MKQENIPNIEPTKSELEILQVLYRPFLFIQTVVHKTNRRWAVFPQYLQYFQFRFSGFDVGCVFLLHKLKVGKFSYEQNFRIFFLKLFFSNLFRTKKPVQNAQAFQLLLNDSAC